jgi:dienelactone hydrolase
MGEVYRAEDTRLNRIVAIKVVSAQLASQQAFRERFEREASAISQLNHPNICTLHDVGHQDAIGAGSGVDFLVMEYVGGDTLADRLAAGRLSLADSIDIALQMARGLAHAHRHGVVHRDVKPANVMFADDGLVKIVDFGVARSARASGRVTETGLAVGTLAYMAPEQLLRDHDVTPACDVWSLGVVLYEMSSGVRPFQGRDVGSVLRSILHEPIPPLPLEGSIGNGLTRILKRALAKDEAERPTAAELVEQLTAFRTGLWTTAKHAAAARRPRPLWVTVAAGVAALGLMLAAIIGGRAAVRSRRASWARTVALPEIDRLVARDEYVAAFNLARQAETTLGDDQALARVWPILSIPSTIKTDPDGATVYVKPYADISSEWQPLGTTPLTTRLPRAALRFRIEKPEFDPVYIARSLTAPFEPQPFVLKASGKSSGMVDVHGDTLPVNLSGFNSEALVPLPAFAIDQTEVTNRAYREFMVAGGYDNPAYWSAGTGRPGSFLDLTGRRGPASWEAGGIPSGRDDDPVTGVSWFEAAAYCAFRGQELPTVYHWARAALAPREITAPLAPSVVPLSNFNGQGSARVGSFEGMGPWGTVDMAGNAREWTWNSASESGRRVILGGAWNDPDYMFSVPFSLPPDDRSPANGFRCMRAESVAGDLKQPVDVASSDYRHARPVSDEIFQVFATQFSYVPAHEAAPVEAHEAVSTGAIREHATIDVGYGGERMRVYVFLPEGRPPYQAVVYFPALNAFQKTSSATFFPADYVIKSGRALVLPVFKGSFERWDSTFGLTGEEYMRALRLRLMEWRQDLGRTLDYLGTRGDIDMKAIAYYGRSFGASMPLPLLALEPRLRVAVLHSGGITYRPLPAEADAVNYVSRVRMPVLMLNGRHDYVMPYETSQKPLFDLFGTPPADKRHVVYDAGHDPLPRSQFIREILAFLDRYLGSIGD